jgi:hypothetical protein
MKTELLQMLLLVVSYEQNFASLTHSPYFIRKYPFADTLDSFETIQ